MMTVSIIPFVVLERETNAFLMVAPCVFFFLSDLSRLEQQMDVGVAVLITV